MLRDNKTDDLERLFKLYNACGNKSIEPIADIFRKHIEDEGMSLVKQARSKHCRYHPNCLALVGPAPGLTGASLVGLAAQLSRSADAALAPCIWWSHKQSSAVSSRWLVRYGYEGSGG